MARIEELTDRYLHGVISAEEQAELNELLESDAAAAEHFAKTSRMEGHLEQAMTERLDRSRWASLLPPKRGPSRRWFILGGVSLVAIAAALAAVLVTQPAGDALLEGALNVAGKPIHKPVRDESMSVSPGAFAKLRLRDGSMLTLHEKTELTIQSANDGPTVIALAKGKADFDVPKASAGFQVTTKACMVETLGTRFSAELLTPAELRASRSKLHPSWRTSVHVTEGTVRGFHDGVETALAAGETKTWVEEVRFSALGRIDAIDPAKRTIAVSVFPKQQGKALTKKELSLTDDLVFPEAPNDPVAGLTVGLIAAFWTEDSESRNVFYIDRLRPMPGRK